jgi:RNA polymerase sigma factor (sigma-70 family)
VGSEVLPHEAGLRRWLRRTMEPADTEDVIQEAYCRMLALEGVDHIRSGRAYLFTTARNVVRERLRRARVVNIETVLEIDALSTEADERSPERVAASRQELARVRQLIEGLPGRCRRIFELRKMDGLSQREVAQIMGVPEYTVEHDIAKGLKLILKALAETEHTAARAVTSVGGNGRVRDSTGDR